MRAVEAAKAFTTIPVLCLLLYLASSLPALAQCDPDEVQKILAGDSAAGDKFGFSVSLSGGKALVGAYGHDAGLNSSGAVFAYEKIATGWTQIAKVRSGSEVRFRGSWPEDVRLENQETADA